MQGILQRIGKASVNMRKKKVIKSQEFMALKRKEHCNCKGHVIEEPETIATAIRIGNPASWAYAVEAAEQSRGEIDMVSDEEILHAYRLLAKTEGVFAEPGSNASLAGVIKHVQSGKIKKGETVVAVLTGNGLKDPDIAISSNQLDIASVSNDIEQIKDHIKGVIMS